MNKETLSSAVTLKKQLHILIEKSFICLISLLELDLYGTFKISNYNFGCKSIPYVGVLSFETVAVYFLEIMIIISVI